MLLNYLTIALRNLRKNKIFSFINITGLSVGIACVLFIFLFIQNELNYDRFHTRGEQIYRVLRLSETNGQQMEIPYTSAPYATGLKNDFPADITHAVRVMPSDGLVTFGDKSFIEKRFFFADSTFFKVFSFPLQQGNPETVLDKTNSIVLSAEMANKYFGQANPIGKTILFEKEMPFEVTGVLAALPGNSHLEFDCIASLAVFRNAEWFDGWWNNNLLTYVYLPEQVQVSKLEAKLPAFMNKYFGQDFKRMGQRTDLRLQPLAEVYFGSHTDFDPSAHGDSKILYLFAAIALFILAIACINFMNLSTARSAGRAREVGMRKVMGAYKSSLITQFLGESIILTLIAVILALVLVVIGLPQFSAFIGKPLAIPFTNPYFVLFLILLTGVVGILAGSYPAFFLSSFQPVKVLKGKFTAGNQAVALRKALVVIQFTISILLIIGTSIVFKQLHYLQEKKLGYDKEHTVLIRVSNNEIYQNRESFKNTLQRIPQVLHVSAMSGEPGGFHDSYPFTVEGKEDEPWVLRTVFTDHDYLQTLGLKLLAGRSFSKTYGTDALEGIILNQTAVKKLGWSPQEALGKAVTNKMRDSLVHRVVGVVEDFHFSSLKEEIQPMAISIGDDNRVIAVKLAPGNPQATLASIGEAWQKSAPQYPFTYEFQDQVYDNLYKTEQKQQVIFGYFAGIAIFIACLGLFGLAAFTSEQRTKEISVRKVLGASIPTIITLLSVDFIKLVGIAILIASPIAWIGMHQWLKDFAYRIAINLDVFLIAGLLAVLIALATVSYHAIRTALTDPAKTLRSE